MKQEFNEYGSHRLVAEDGRVTQWTGYTGWCYLDGVVGCTDYYSGQGEKMLTPEEFVKFGAVEDEPIELK